MGVFIGVLAGLFLFSLGVNAFLLWLSCRLLGARGTVAAKDGTPPLLVRIGYRRALVAVLFLVVANVALTVLLGFKGLLTGGPLLVWLLGLALFVCVTFLCLWLLLRLTAGKAVQVTLLSGVLFGGYAVGCVEALRLWVGEAYLTPTGAMAQTLLGHHKHVQCPSCGFEFDLNASAEAAPGPEREAIPINGCTCPNCRQLLRLVSAKREGRDPENARGREYREIADPGLISGDWFLMVKGPLFRGPMAPQRFDPVAFSYPDRPDFRYIKRLAGLPGETVALQRGKLYRLAPQNSPTYTDDAPPEELRRLLHAHANDPKARTLFEAGKFEILRKPPELILSTMLPVHDNDHQPEDLTEKKWQRWLAEGDWKSEEKTTFVVKGSDRMSWLHYRHLLRQLDGKPSLITDFMGYNSGESLMWEDFQKRWVPHPAMGSQANGSNWVGDLVLECEVQAEQTEGELVLQLVRGGDTFRATWDLSSANGLCTLTRTTGRRDGKQETVKLGDARPTRLGKGKHRLRFANVDDRLTVWVDGELPFGDGETYPVEHPERVVPTAADLQPAAIGVKGGSLSVRHIKLFRDIYYTIRASVPDVLDFGRLTSPEEWKDVKEMPLLTLYVQPNHYFCLGDNSTASSDSRSWGMVPERLLLGKAMLVYYPFARARRLR